jgi:PKD repeat protein
MKNMKYIISKLGAFTLLCIILMGCNPQEDKHYDLGALDTVTADQVSFSYSISATNSKEVTFTNTSKVSVPYSLLWDFGNGKTDKGQIVTHKYTASGQYTVKLKLYTADGTSASKSETITIQ